MTKYLEFEEKNDEEIAIEAKAGNVIAQEYLINKYESFVKTKAKSYKKSLNTSEKNPPRESVLFTDNL